MRPKVLEKTLKRVDLHLFDIAGSVGVDVMKVDPTAPCYRVKKVFNRFHFLPVVQHPSHTRNGG